MSGVNALNLFRFLVCLGLAFNLIFSSSCSTAEKNADTPEGAFKIAQEFDKGDRFEEALRRYADVRSKYPYSKFAKMAELAIADVYYKQESFSEAQVSYQNFKELNPKHPQVDYVTFRIAMSYFKQLPSSVDRDLSLAPNAILYFDEVLSSYPNSTHINEAREYKKQALKMMAEKELYIAKFYLKKSNYLSALGRFEDLYFKYSPSGLEAEALAGAAISAKKLGELEKARKYLSELEKKFPNSNELSRAKKEVH